MQCIPVGIETITNAVHHLSYWTYTCTGAHTISRIEPAQGNQKLMRAGMPALPVELARLELSTFAKEAWYYDVPFMHATICSYPSLCPLMNRV